MALSCGCIPDASGFGYCNDCNMKLRVKLWKRMSEKERRYDRRFAPEQSKELDKTLYDGTREYNTGCSCHINPPCSYCMSNNEEEKS